jgi:hypothetical protein
MLAHEQARSVQPSICCININAERRGSFDYRHLAQVARLKDLSVPLVQGFRRGQDGCRKFLALQDVRR